MLLGNFSDTRGVLGEKDPGRKHKVMFEGVRADRQAGTPKGLAPAAAADRA